jgi:hypothetical protein
VETVHDMIWEFDASRDYDPSPYLELIDSPLLAVNFADDELNPVELGGLECAINLARRGLAVTLLARKDSFATRPFVTLSFAGTACASSWNKRVKKIVHPEPAPHSRTALATGFDSITILEFLGSQECEGFAARAPRFRIITLSF